MIELPPPQEFEPERLMSVLRRRESHREYVDLPLSISNVSQLLFAAQGLSRSGAKRLTPSAGGKYPLSLFLVARRVTGVPAGIYRYKTGHNALAKMESGNIAQTLEDSALGEQPWVSSAAAIVVVAGDTIMMNRAFAEQPPLNQRGTRYVYMEAGAAIQNMHLQATVLNIGLVLVGGFDDDKVRSFLKADGKLAPCALVCLGSLREVG